MKRKHSKKTLRKIARVHLIFSVGLFILYVALAAIYSPEFLISDIREKSRVLADETIAITARVLGPPAEPIISGSAVCSNGNLRVRLVWPIDKNSETFSIKRNDLPLVDGLVDYIYRDKTVTAGTSYIYVVTAYGPMGPGNAVSQPVSITTPDDCSANYSHEVAISTLSQKSISNSNLIPTTDSRQPLISGTTSIPNAVITLFLHSSELIYAQTVANANGYWSWIPPISLETGTHELYISAKDPEDPEIEILKNFYFNIVDSLESVKSENKNDGNKNDSREKLPSNNEIYTGPVSSLSNKYSQEEKPAEIPINFSLSLGENKILQGKNLVLEFTIDKLDSSFEGSRAVINYTVFNEKGESKLSIPENAVINQGEKIKKEITIPGYFKSGQYRLRTEIVFGQYNISQEQFFSIIERPIIKLGGGLTINYPELLSRLGLIVIIASSLLLIWILLFFIEYWLQLHALRRITERSLRKIGFLGPKRKGVSR